MTLNNPRTNVGVRLLVTADGPDVGRFSNEFTADTYADDMTEEQLYEALRELVSHIAATADRWAYRRAADAYDWPGDRAAPAVRATAPVQPPAVLLDQAKAAFATGQNDPDPAAVAAAVVDDLRAAQIRADAMVNGR